MPDYQEAVAAFQSRFGPEWYMFLNSPLWRAARAVLTEFSPSRKLPSAASPADIVQFGAVFAANDQGYFDALGTLESLGVHAGNFTDPSLDPTYGAEEFAVTTPSRPAPAPEAPPLPQRPPAPRHRKASPKPTTKKR